MMKCLFSLILIWCTESGLNVEFNWKALFIEGPSKSTKTFTGKPRVLQEAKPNSLFDRGAIVKLFDIQWGTITVPMPPHAPNLPQRDK